MAASGGNRLGRAVRLRRRGVDAPGPSLPRYMLVLLLALHFPARAAGVLRNLHHSGSSSHPSYMVQFSGDANVMLFSNYGFETGGKISISVDAKMSDTTETETGDRSMLWVLGCTEQEYDAILRSEFQSNDGYCSNGMYANWDMCTCKSWNVTMDHRGVENRFYHASRKIEEVMPEKELLYFFLVSCEVLGSSVPLRSCTADDRSFENSATMRSHRCTQSWPEMIGRELSVSLTYTFENPGQYLSFTEEPYIVVFATLSVAWIPITIAWLFLTWRMRNTVDTSLQRRMALLPLAKNVVLALVFAKWELKSEGAPYRYSMPFLFPALLIMRVAYAAAFAETLMLIGKGWKLTREHLHPIERRNIYTVVAMYCVGSLLYFLWGLQSSSVALLTLLLLGLTYMVVLYSVWFACSQNIAAVRFHLDAIRFRDIDPLTTPVFATYSMLRQFRSTFFGYLVVVAFSDIVTVSVARRKPWIPLLSNELLEMAACVIIGYIFRARPFEHARQRAQTPAAVAPDPNAEDAAAAAVAAVDEEAGAQLQPWRPGVELPVNPRADLLFPHGPTGEDLVVIQYPGSADGDCRLSIGIPPGAKGSPERKRTSADRPTIAVRQSLPGTAAGGAATLPQPVTGHQPGGSPPDPLSRAGGSQ